MTDNFIYRIGKLALAPGDLVVVKTELVLDKEQATRIRELMSAQLAAAGFHNRVLLLTSGMDLQVIEKKHESR